MKAFNTVFTIPKGSFRALTCILLGIKYLTFLAFNTFSLIRVKIWCLWTGWALFTIKYWCFCWTLITLLVFFWINLIFRTGKTHLRTLVKIRRERAFNTLVCCLVWLFGWTLAYHFFFIFYFSICTSLACFCFRVIDFFSLTFTSIWIFIVNLILWTFSTRSVNIQWSLWGAKTFLSY